MNDSIVSYISKSKISLNTIVENLEKNIEYLDNNLWNNYDEFKDSFNGIIDIYYDKYFLYKSNDFSKISKYINFNNKINRRLKTILLAVIDYFESNDRSHIIREKEGSILYLNILIYLALVIYDKNLSDIDSPKKIEKVINNVIDNFQKIRFRREKDLVTLITNIKTCIDENNTFNKLVSDLSKDSSHNIFININKDTNYYKVIYEYDIKGLNQYDDKDIKIVNDMMNIGEALTNISFDLCYYTVFNLLKNGLDYVMLFPISKKQLMNIDFIKLIKSRSNYLMDNIKFLVRYEDIINDYEFVNLMKEKEIDIYIDVNNQEETNNYNMFMDNKNILVSDEFISINEKYVEIWKDMGMNFVIKNMGSRLTLKELMNRK